MVLIGTRFSVGVLFSEDTLVRWCSRETNGTQTIGVLFPQKTTHQKGPEV